jgi:hypothetical protein
VAKKSKISSKAEKDKESSPTPVSQNWLSMRSGLIIMTLVSLAFTGFVAWNYYQSAGIFKAILIGLMFGGILWAIFVGNLYFNRFIRRKK